MFMGNLIQQNGKWKTEEFDCPGKDIIKVYTKLNSNLKYHTDEYKNKPGHLELQRTCYAIRKNEQVTRAPPPPPSFQLMSGW